MPRHPPLLLQCERPEEIFQEGRARRPRHDVVLKLQTLLRDPERPGQRVVSATTVVLPPRPDEGRQEEVALLPVINLPKRLGVQQPFVTRLR